jgi:hypothetical protein
MKERFEGAKGDKDFGGTGFKRLTSMFVFAKSFERGFYSKNKFILIFKFFTKCL